MISICILTHNDARTLQNCLESISWGDEVVVVDDNSTDSSVALVKKIIPKARIFSRALEGNFAAQRNFALEKAKGDWVLFVDPDEIVTPRLRVGIMSAIKAQRTNGFLLRRRDVFFGKRLYFGETGHIRLLRLGKKGKGQWSREVHEKWNIEGRVMEISAPLEHYPHPTIKEFLYDLNFYTSIDATHMYLNDGVRFSYFRAIANPVGKFIQNFVLKLGFLDGLPGFIIAAMMSLHSLMVRIKLYEFKVKPR